MKEPQTNLRTYNVKHNLDLSDMLVKARSVAEYSTTHPRITSKDVKHFGLKSALAKSIIWKYARDKKLKSVHNIVIPIDNQNFKWDGLHIILTPINRHTISFLHTLHPEIIKVHHIELDDTYAHIICEVKTEPMYEPKTILGVDRNTTGHTVVASCLETGKVWKLGKKCQHIHTKYSNLRRKAQREGCKKKHHKFRKVKKLKHRESNIVKDINHKMSKKIVDIAKENQSIIVMEDLTNIRDTAKTNKSFRYSLNSWSFYQFEQFVSYKTNQQGVPMSFVNPAYTSQNCSRCGALGNRDGKIFKCGCGHHDHADTNAGFNIALKYRLMSDRDDIKGCIEHPNGATS